MWSGAIETKIVKDLLLLLIIMMFAVNMVPKVPFCMRGHGLLIAKIGKDQ